MSSFLDVAILCSIIISVYIDSKSSIFSSFLIILDENYIHLANISFFFYIVPLLIYPHLLLCYKYKNLLYKLNQFPYILKVAVHNDFLLMPKVPFLFNTVATSCGWIPFILNDITLACSSISFGPYISIKSSSCNFF